MTQDTLEAKRARLEELEKSEREARRLEDALGRGRISGIGARAGGVRASTSASASAATSAPRSQSQTRAQRRHSSVHGGEVDRDGDRDQDEEAGEGEDEDSSDEPREPRDLYLPPHPGPNPARRKSASSAPGMGLNNALSYTLHGMMDVDPEAARRKWDYEDAGEHCIGVLPTSLFPSPLSYAGNCFPDLIPFCRVFSSFYSCGRSTPSIRARPQILELELFKRIWTGSSGRKSLICGRWLSVWQGAIGIGVKRFVLLLL